MIWEFEQLSQKNHFNVFMYLVYETRNHVIHLLLQPPCLSISLCRERSLWELIGQVWSNCSTLILSSVHSTASHTFPICCACIPTANSLPASSPCVKPYCHNRSSLTIEFKITSCISDLHPVPPAFFFPIAHDTNDIYYLCVPSLSAFYWNMSSLRWFCLLLCHQCLNQFPAYCRHYSNIQIFWIDLFKKVHETARCQWLMLVILCTLEVKIRRVRFWVSLSKKFARSHLKGKCWRWWPVHVIPAMAEA
jgi:hypothetical protein